MHKKKKKERERLGEILLSAKCKCEVDTLLIILILLYSGPFFCDAANTNEVHMHVQRTHMCMNTRS